MGEIVRSETFDTSPQGRRGSGFEGVLCVSALYLSTLHVRADGIIASLRSCSLTEDLTPGDWIIADESCSNCGDLICCDVNLACW